MPYKHDSIILQFSSRGVVQTPDAHPDHSAAQVVCLFDVPSTSVSGYFLSSNHAGSINVFIPFLCPLIVESPDELARTTQHGIEGGQFLQFHRNHSTAVRTKRHRVVGDVHRHTPAAEGVPTLGHDPTMSPVQVGPKLGVVGLVHRRLLADATRQSKNLTRVLGFASARDVEAGTLEDVVVEFISGVLADVIEAIAAEGTAALSEGEDS